ncbi:MAG: PDDEXK nuclease domain-containing protein [Evtepia sp.]
MPFNLFKDSYFLDVLGLKDNFLEGDSEKAILVEMEKFILEFGHGFSFAEQLYFCGTAEISVRHQTYQRLL